LITSVVSRREYRPEPIQPIHDISIILLIS
jgi:hypothetical protein